MLHGNQASPKLTTIEPPAKANHNPIRLRSVQPLRIVSGSLMEPLPVTSDTVTGW